MAIDIDQVKVHKTRNFFDEKINQLFPETCTHKIEDIYYIPLSFCDKQFWDVKKQKLIILQNFWKSSKRQLMSRIKTNHALIGVIHVALNQIIEACSIMIDTCWDGNTSNPPIPYHVWTSLENELNLKRSDILHKYGMAISKAKKSDSGKSDSEPNSPRNPYIEYNYLVLTKDRASKFKFYANYNELTQKDILNWIAHKLKEHSDRAALYIKDDITMFFKKLEIDTFHISLIQIDSPLTDDQLQSAYMFLEHASNFFEEKLTQSGAKSVNSSPSVAKTPRRRRKQPVQVDSVCSFYELPGETVSEMIINVLKSEMGTNESPSPTNSLETVSPRSNTSVSSVDNEKGSSPSSEGHWKPQSSNTCQSVNNNTQHTKTSCLSELLSSNEGVVKSSEKTFQPIAPVPSQPCVVPDSGALGNPVSLPQAPFYSIEQYALDKAKSQADLMHHFLETLYKTEKFRSPYIQALIKVSNDALEFYRRKCYTEFFIYQSGLDEKISEFSANNQLDSLQGLFNCGVKELIPVTCKNQTS